MTEIIIESDNFVQNAYYNLDSMWDFFLFFNSYSIFYTRIHPKIVHDM